MTEGNGHERDAGRPATRLAAGGALALVACAVVTVRLVSLAAVGTANWRAEADRQQQRAVTLAPDRGSFLDRNGLELAGSVPAWSAWIDPSALRDRSAAADAARRLAARCSTPEPTLRRRLAGDRLFAWVGRQLRPEERDALLRLGVPGLGFVKESRRAYPHGLLASDLLGMVGIDGRGLEGLEHALDADVAGKPGRLIAACDARGTQVLPAGFTHRPPRRGADVVLTIDAALQHVVERELDLAMQSTRSRAGSVLVTLPGTGEIAALANRPTFHPDKLPTDPSHLRTNRAVASCHEPGSTLKIFTAAAALESGAVRPDEVFDCGGGSILIGKTRRRDHHPFGRLDVAGILEQSSNVGAIHLARRAGARRLHDTLESFGFGKRTGIGLPGESAGILRDAASWSDVSLATIAFGQEIAASPLQLAMAASAVASGGTLRAPRLVREIRRADGTVGVPEVAAPRRVLSRATAATLSLMLEGVVLRGTGRAAAVPGHRVAGKTGTAQVIGDDGTYRTDAFIASFVGWLPADDPAFLVLVVLEEPRGEYHGGDVAAPVFAAIARDAARILAVPPSGGLGPRVAAGKAPGSGREHES